MVKKLKRKGDASAAPAPKAAAPGPAKPDKFKKKAVKPDPAKLKAAAAESSGTAEASASAPETALKTAPKPVEGSPAAAKATANGVVAQSKREEAANGGVAQSNNEERKTNRKEMVKGKAEEKGQGEDRKSTRKETMKGRDEERTKRDEKRGAGKEEDDDERSGSGYIFMCNTKTKPECYRNGVFGLPRGKMDVVEKIRPGAKLFLYDFDLKLMYGVYKAETRGGLDLVRSAFDGKFPAQVKFSVDIDCLPIPESNFKHAIKENYNSKGRFTQELSSKQVHRLLALFKPASLSQPAPQHIDERCPLIIEDRRKPYGYDEQRHVEERVAPINFHASPLEDHYKITHSLCRPLYDEPRQVPIALGSHHMPHMQELQHVPPYYHQVAPSRMDAMHERTAAEPIIRDPLARDYGALPGELAARSQHVDDLYRSYKLSTRTMDLHPGPSYVTSYEDPRSVYSEIRQRPISTRFSGPSVPVSSRYSFTGPPTFR